MTELKAPFCYFGGKSSIADKVWEAIGSPAHYIEPFFGSGAVLLARPNHDPAKDTETVNDKDGYIANVWRALQFNPDEVAKWCDWPVNHADLSARKMRLIREEEYLIKGLIKDDKWFDAELAGYWIWASCCWIGSGLTSIGQIPHIGNAGMVVHAIGKRPQISDAGNGVHAIGKIPHIGNAGSGVQEPYNTNIYKWFRELSQRLRYVRVVCGDWTRVCGGDWQDKIGDVGIFFDPPYSGAIRNPNIYHQESGTVAAEVNKWCLERGEKPSYRIVLAGYYEEHENLLQHGWTVTKWTAKGGYSNSGSVENKNRFKEALFFSPHCLKNELFA